MKQELETEEMLLHSPFEEVKRQMEGEAFWIRIFIRPFSPKPNEHMAHLKIKALREELETRTDFTPEQHAELSALVDKGESWYVERFC